MSLSSAMGAAPAFPWSCQTPLRSRFGAGLEFAVAFAATCCGAAFALTETRNASPTVRSAAPERKRKEQNRNVNLFARKTTANLSHVHLQNVTVREDDLAILVAGKTDRRAILGGREGHGNLVPGLECGSRPVVALHDAGALA